MRLPTVSYADVVKGLSMPGERIYLDGEDYYLDERLGELRGVKTADTVDLNELEVEWFKERAKR